ncbi:MAG: hypothetical protein BWY91_03150 [bacterium ADurb.BinA028]|nr:MAG: hypothetical protein BWY91_03150 [bacterium ADurb.BinA028]
MPSTRRWMPSTWPTSSAPLRPPAPSWRRRSPCGPPRAPTRSAPSGTPTSTRPGSGRSVRPDARSPGPSPTFSTWPSPVPASSSRCPPPSTERGWRRTSPISSRGCRQPWPRVPSSRSGGCGSSRTATCSPASRYAASSPSARDGSPNAWVTVAARCGCPTRSAIRRPCRSSLGWPECAGCSLRRSRGTRSTASRTTRSSGRALTGRESSRISLPPIPIRPS